MIFLICSFWVISTQDDFFNLFVLVPSNNIFNLFASRPPRQDDFINLFGLGAFVAFGIIWLHVCCHSASSTGADDRPDMILLICSDAAPR